jgi:sporulation protein YlmC with PRC-barrel domain
MYKCILVAAVLGLAPFPAMSQQQAQREQQRSQGAMSEQEVQQEQQRSSDRESSRTMRESQRGGDLLDRLSRSELRDRVGDAIETVEDACVTDIANFCGDVTPGQGRVAMCMRAYEDQLSRRCQSALYRVSSNFHRAVANMTDECWRGIQAQCGSAEKIGQCAKQKIDSLSPACQAVVAAVSDVAEGVRQQLKGMPVYSADNKNLGQVVEVTRDSDGKIKAIQVQVGRMLGLGDKVVTIEANKIEQLANQIRLRLGADEVRSLPSAKPGP